MIGNDEKECFLMENREQLYRAVHPEGTHLAASKDTEGSYRGVLLDNETNRVVGQAEFVLVEPEPEPEPEPPVVMPPQAVVPVAPPESQSGGMPAWMIAVASVLSTLIAMRLLTWLRRQ